MVSASTLKWRIGLGGVMILVLAALAGADAHFYTNPGSGVLGRLLGQGLIIAVLASVLAGAGALELSRLARSGGYETLPGVMVAGSALAPLAVVLVCPMTSWWPQAGEFIGLFLLVAFAAQMMRRETAKAAGRIAWTVFGILYVGVLTAYAVRVRRDFGLPAFVLLLAVAKGGDIGAYFTGIALGRRKLIPWLSPGKTVEGLAGALATTAVLTVVITQFVPIIHVGWVARIGIGVLLGAAAHFGDLMESLIKRDCSAKDSGRLLPEFGGVLDLIDSVLPTGLVWYIILSNITM